LWSYYVISLGPTIWLCRLHS